MKLLQKRPDLLITSTSESIEAPVVVNPDTCMINAEDDAVIQMDSCGAEILELCMNMVAIVDEAYPFIMKTCFK